MLTQLPPELLRNVTFYLESTDLLNLVSIGSSLLSNRLQSGNGCDSLALIAPYSIKLLGKAVPKGLKHFRRLRTIILRPENLNTPGNYNSSPGIDWIGRMPASLTQLSITADDPLISFLSPNLSSTLTSFPSSGDLLKEWASIYQEEGKEDPWLPLEHIMPNLKSLELFSHSFIPLRQGQSIDAIGTAMWRFLCHLPPTMREFHSNILYTGSGKWAAALPRSLESWSSPSRALAFHGWEPPDLTDHATGQSLPSTSYLTFGVMASQIPYFPTTLTSIHIDANCEVESLVHFPLLMSLRCKHLNFGNPTESRSKRLCLCSLLPKTLNKLATTAIDATDEELMSTEGKYPMQILSLQCCFSPDFANLLPFLPPKLTSLHFGTSLIQGLAEEIQLLPQTLTFLDMSVREWIPSAFSYFPEHLRSLNLKRGRVLRQPNEEWSSKDFLLFPFLSHIQKLAIAYSPPIELTSEIFHRMPNALDIEIPQAILNEKNIPLRHQSRLRSVIVGTIIISGHGFSENPPDDLITAASGLITNGLMMSAFTTWIRSSNRVLVTSAQLNVMLERLPVGATSLRHLTWHSSEIDFLPPTLTELSGGFEIRYQDIPKLPKSVTAVRDMKFIIDEKAAGEILKKISSSDRFHLSLPYDLYNDCCLGTNIKNQIFSQKNGSSVKVTNTTMSLLWPELTTLVLADPFPLLSMKCFHYIPRSLTKLKVIYEPVSTLMWSLVPELNSLTSLTAIPRENLIHSDWQSLPASLLILELNYNVELGVTSKQKPNPESLLSIPVEAVPALPRKLTNLVILWPCDLSDLAIQHLPQSLQELKLESPNIVDPPFHHFPPTLRSISLKSTFTGTSKLLEYLHKKRKSNK